MRIQICVSSLNQSLKRRAELLLRRGVVLYEELREQSTEMWICVVCVGERRNVKIALQPWLPRPSFLTEPQAVTKKCKKRKPRLLLPPMHSGQKYHFFNLVSYDQCAFLVRIIFFRSFYCTQFSAYHLVRIFQIILLCIVQCVSFSAHLLMLTFQYAYSNAFVVRIIFYSSFYCTQFSAYNLERIF